MQKITHGALSEKNSKDLLLVVHFTMK